MQSHKYYHVWIDLNMINLELLLQTPDFKKCDQLTNPLTNWLTEQNLEMLSHLKRYLFTNRIICCESSSRIYLEMFCQKIGFIVAIILLITIVKAKDFLLGQEAVFTCQVNVFPILNNLSHSLQGFTIFLFSVW